MSAHVLEPEQRTAARIAGIWYLAAMAIGIFADVFVRGRMVSSSGAAQTAINIIASPHLFRFGFVCHLFVFAGDVVLAVALYVVLRPVNRNLALLAACWRVIDSAILSVVILNDFIALRFLSGGDSMRVFDTSQLQALARLFLTVDRIGFQIGFVFLGLGSTVYSYLWFRSRYIPRGLAAWGIFSSFVMAFVTMAIMVFPDFGNVISMSYLVPMFFYEVGLGLWLVVKGIQAP
jgi:hypothetical protein